MTDTVFLFTRVHHKKRIIRPRVVIGLTKVKVFFCYQLIVIHKQAFEKRIVVALDSMKKIQIYIFQLVDVHTVRFAVRTHSDNFANGLVSLSRMVAAL